MKTLKTKVLYLVAIVAVVSLFAPSAFAQFGGYYGGGYSGDGNCYYNNTAANIACHAASTAGNIYSVYTVGKIANKREDNRHTETMGQIETQDAGVRGGIANQNEQIRGTIEVAKISAYGQVAKDGTLPQVYAAVNGQMGDAYGMGGTPVKVQICNHDPQVTSQLIFKPANGPEVLLQGTGCSQPLDYSSLVTRQDENVGGIEFGLNHPTEGRCEVGSFKVPPAFISHVDGNVYRVELNHRFAANRPCLHGQMQMTTASAAGPNQGQAPLLGVSSQPSR